jgi:2-polyprenyl-3-methyl-5-hydroxy-6-metoxy-1,4-benzoquinol methylase
LARELDVNVQQGTLYQRLLELNERFDLISLFHVLEHLPNPVQSLQAIASKLSRDGLLYIEVPNATWPCSPHYMFFRAHTLYFTAAGLTSTLAAAGLQIVADNFESGEDLRVVAKSTSHQHQPVFLPSDALRAAQRNRWWGPYLLRQFARMTMIDKLKKRQAEKRLARQLGSARSIVDRAMQEHLRA